MWPIVFDFPEDTENWTSGSVEGPFSPPEFTYEPDNVVMISSTNTNTFGFWQSPENAIPADSDYLYWARYRVSTDMENKALVPQIRLRANSLNLEQYDFVSIESAGDGASCPSTSGTDYDLYFVPPANDDFVVLSFDLLNFNPDDSAEAQLWLDTVTIDRIPLAALSPATVVWNYTFDVDTEGWTMGSAPVFFEEPEYSHADGALQMRATTNTNTFGYWGSNPADITIQADRLYRGTFEVRTDVTDPALVPEMRLRFNMANLQASHTFGIASNGTGGNSPGTTNTTYDRLYFLPPPSCVGEGLIVSFDILNFNAEDAAPASLILDRATIETLSPPF